MRRQTNTVARIAAGALADVEREVRIKQLRAQLSKLKHDTLIDEFVSTIQQLGAAQIALREIRAILDRYEQNHSSQRTSG